MPGQIWETAGKVRMIPKGTYNPNREYEPLDMVSDENNLKYYIAKSKVSPGIDLSDREYWHVIADVSQLRGPAGGNCSINIEQINNTNDYQIDFVESGNTIVNSIAGKTGTVALNAGDVEYDNTGTYASGTIGAGIAELNKIGDISYNLWEKESSYTFTRYIEVTGVSIPAGTYTMSAIVESNDIDKNVCRILFRNSSMNEICHYFFDRGARCDRLIELNENCSSIIFYASETANYSTGDTATWSNIMLVSGDRIVPYSGHTTAHDATSRLILKNYFEGILNVKDFGARGDGVTDDTAAFKAMFSENAKTYYIPSGSYIVQPFICGTDKTNGKQITQNIKICGDGAGLTRLQLKNYSIPAEGPLSENGCMMFLMEGPSGQGDKVTIEISDLYIDMNRRHNNYDSTFDPDEFDEWYLQHCHAICIRSHAVSSVNVIVKNVEFYDLIADGICFNGNSASNSFDGILVDGVISKGRTAPRSDVCITGDFNSAIVANCSLDDFEIEVNYFTQANTHYFEMSNCTIRRKIDFTSKWNPSLPETVIRNSSKYLVNNCNIFGKVNFSSLHVMFTSCHFSISESVYVQNADAQFLDCEIEDDKTLVADWDSPGLFYCIEDTKGNKFKFSGCQIRCRHYRNFLCTKNAITDNNTNINDITIENCHIVVSLIHDSSYGGNFIRVGNMNVYAIGNKIDLTGDANSSFILIGYPYKTSRTIVIKNNVLLKNSVLFKSSANMGDDGIVITVKAKGNVPYNSDYNIFRWMFDEITSTRGGTGSTYNIIEANDYESDNLPSNGMWVRGQKIYNTRPETNNILAWCCTQNGYANSTPTAVFEPIYMGSKFDELKSEIGDLSDLDTTAKINLVAAINEAAQSGPASGNFTVTETRISGENYELDLDDNGEDLAGEIAELKSALHPYDHSTNYLNPDDILIDYQINASGVAESYAGRCASGWIEARNGDTVYFTGINEVGAMLSPTGVSMLRLAWYNSNKEFISAATWVNSYTLNDSNIAYIRFCYSNSATFQRARRIALMFTQPTTAADIEKYYVAGYDVTDITARNNMRIVVPDTFVDAWGDSRIANGAESTSVDKYLANMLGWYTANHGYGGQGSGEIAITMGAIDCYVTIANNQIMDGDNVVSAIAINHGNSVQNVMQNSNVAANGVPCSVGGVEGFLWRYGGELKFTTASELLSPVTVMPMTKVITPLAMLHRFIIIWAGKNDFSNYSASGLYEYLADTVSAMAEHIPHDRFVILGETATSSDEYKFGGAARTVMDNYNNLMARRFPNNFIDVQSELVNHGLEMAGITPTETDTADIANGWIPSSLMSDNTHQNEIGRQVIAQIIYNYMADKSWT